MLFDIVNQYDAKKIAFLTDLWTTCLHDLAAHNDIAKIVVFLGKAGIISIDDQNKTVYLGTPNDFTRSQIKKFFGKTLKKTITQCYNQSYTIEIVSFPLFTGNHPLRVDVKKVLNFTPKKSQTPPMPITPNSSRTSLSHDHLNGSSTGLQSKYTFESLVVGGNNQLAASAAESVAMAPGITYNPLFIYGPVGLGKTHILQAIGNKVVKTKTDKRVCYLPALQLIDTIIKAIQTKKMDAFYKHMRTIDVLIVDDIQFLAHKEKTQEIFHRIFNQFVNDRRQIVLSSDCSPRELNLLEARLRSRFATGLVADIQKPDYETKRAILLHKITRKDIHIDEKILHLLAHYITDSIRDLEGALNLLFTKQSMGNKELDEGDALETLRTLGYDPRLSTTSDWSAASRKNTKNTQSYDTLVAFVANYYDLAVNDIVGVSRKKTVSRARQMLMYIAKNRYNRTLEKIGTYFGGKNHSSVIYAIDTFAKHLKRDPHIQHDFAIVKNES